MIFKKFSSKKKLSLGLGAGAFLLGSFLLVNGVKADSTTVCDDPSVLLCDTFQGTTLYKDENSNALFFRYVNGFNHPDDPQIAKYTDLKPGLQLSINTNSTNDNYSNSDISTSVINDGTSSYLRFGVNTRAEARIKFDPKMLPQASNPGNTKGSTGLLYWDYFKNPVNPEDGIITNARDVIGFSWQDSASTLPGFKAIAAIDGTFALYDPIENINLGDFNTYAIERRHDSLKWFVNGTQVAELPINQTGTLQLPDSQGLAEDAWVDNASYQYVLGTTLTGYLTFNHLTQDNNIQISYFKISSINP